MSATKWRIGSRGGFNANQIQDVATGKPICGVFSVPINRDIEEVRKLHKEAGGRMEGCLKHSDLILTAVNHHDELIAMIDRLAELLKSTAVILKKNHLPETACRLRRAAKEARALVKRVKGTTPC